MAQAWNRAPQAVLVLINKLSSAAGRVPLYEKNGDGRWRFWRLICRYLVQLCHGRLCQPRHGFSIQCCHGSPLQSCHGSSSTRYLLPCLSTAQPVLGASRRCCARSIIPLHVTISRAVAECSLCQPRHGFSIQCCHGSRLQSCHGSCSTRYLLPCLCTAQPVLCASRRCCTRSIIPLHDTMSRAVAESSEASSQKPARII